MLFIDISENQNLRNLMGLQKMNLQKHGKTMFLMGFIKFSWETYFT
jgi:hypothetical protein